MPNMFGGDQLDPLYHPCAKSNQLNPREEVERFDDEGGAMQATSVVKQLDPLIGVFGDHTGWPTDVEVLEELRRRNPQRYNNCRALNYFRGSSPTPPTVEQIADQFEAFDNMLEDPLENLISRLGGELFLLEDSLVPQHQVINEPPYVVEVEMTTDQNNARNQYRLYKEIEQLLIRLRPLVDKYGYPDV